VRFLLQGGKIHPASVTARDAQLPCRAQIAEPILSCCSALSLWRKASRTTSRDEL
jgi:hypothetical protein